MPSPSDHHGNPCTSRHGVVSCVLPCPASMATANLPNSSVDDNLQDFLLLPLLLPLFLSLSSSLLKKNPFIPVKCDSDLVPYDNRFERNASSQNTRSILSRCEPIEFTIFLLARLYIYFDRMLLARYARINIEYLQVTIYTLSVCKNIYTEKLGSFDQFSLYRIVREDFILFLGSAV